MTELPEIEFDLSCMENDKTPEDFVWTFEGSIYRIRTVEPTNEFDASTYVMDIKVADGWRELNYHDSIYHLLKILQKKRMFMRELDSLTRSLARLRASAGD